MRSSPISRSLRRQPSFPSKMLESRVWTLSNNFRNDLIILCGREIIRFTVLMCTDYGLKFAKLYFIMCMHALSFSDLISKQVEKPVEVMQPAATDVSVVEVSQVTTTGEQVAD